MSIVPRTLLWRSFLLIAGVMLLSVLAWFAIFTHFEREPRSRQLAQTIVSVANLTRTALVTARPEARIHLLSELSEREGIHVYPAEADDVILPLPDRPFLMRVKELVRERLGDETRFAIQRDDERALFVSFRLEPGDDDEYWLALPRERLERFFPLEWIGWAAAALLLSLAGAWLLVARLEKPLRKLAAAAKEIGRGARPEPVPVEGPAEVETLALAFNQMGADLARLDEDRALLLAGVSHDLRTPLTRLRMGVELSNMDDVQRADSIADIEEMDRTIGQFLDFARPDGGEARQPTDLAALLDELVRGYRHRGANMTLDAAPATVPVRPKALRRAVANLIENALRHAGAAQPIDVALRRDGAETRIEVGDRGPGIPAAEAERLKLPFTRLDEARSGATGAGLGLAIVDRIARADGGRLELLPREGGGLLARITLISEPK